MSMDENWLCRREIIVAWNGLKNSGGLSTIRPFVSGATLIKQSELGINVIWTTSKDGDFARARRPSSPKGSNTMAHRAHATARRAPSMQCVGRTCAAEQHRSSTQWKYKHTHGLATFGYRFFPFEWHVRSSQILCGECIRANKNDSFSNHLFFYRSLKK